MCIATRPSPYARARHFKLSSAPNNGVGAGQYRLWVHGPNDATPDNTGARVLSMSVNYNTKTGAPMSTLVTLSEDIDSASFTGADVSFVNAAGVVRHPSSVQATGFGSRQFLIFVGTIAQGDYTLKIGPNINDFAGNKLNQDGDLFNGESVQDVYSEFFTLETLDLDAAMQTTRILAGFSFHAPIGVGTRIALPTQGAEKP